MNRDRVMLLIDADNVSLDIVEQAVLWVHHRHGGPHVRRAYCTAECAVRHQAAFKQLGIRPMVNLAAGKNSTDIALAVDAIDLAVSERPDVMVIVSSDSDFAPLVSRLREKGCRVVGIGQEGKIGGETQAIYDDYEVLAHRGSVPAASDKPRAKTPAKPAASKKTASKSAPGSAAPSADNKAQQLLDALLGALPELARGEELDLNVAVKRLRERKLLGKNASSIKLFSQYGERFKLTPAGKPNKVRLRL
jgi:uncharacterized protein (TIGR00288 family)